MTVTVFGYLILISIDFYDFISPFSPKFWFQLRRYIKYSRQCSTTFPVRQKYSCIFNSPLGVRKCGQTRFFVFDILLKL